METKKQKKNAYMKEYLKKKRKELKELKEMEELDKEYYTNLINEFFLRKTKLLVTTEMQQFTHIDSEVERL